MRNKDDDNNYEKKDLFGIMRESKTSPTTKKERKKRKTGKKRGEIGKEKK